MKMPREQGYEEEQRAYRLPMACGELVFGGFENEEYLATWKELHELSEEEVRLVAATAMRVAMQGTTTKNGQGAVAFVREIANIFGFSDAEVKEAAREVLRGALRDPHPPLETIYHVVRWFLEVPEGHCFRTDGYIYSLKATRLNPEEVTWCVTRGLEEGYIVCRG